MGPRLQWREVIQDRIWAAACGPVYLMVQVVAGDFVWSVGGHATQDKKRGRATSLIDAQYAAEAAALLWMRHALEELGCVS